MWYLLCARAKVINSGWWIVFGLGLAARTSLGIIATLFLFGSTIGYRMNVEENAFRKEFGENYVEYSKKTKRLIPFLF